MLLKEKHFQAQPVALSLRGLLPCRLLARLVNWVTNFSQTQSSEQFLPLPGFLLHFCF